MDFSFRDEREVGVCACPGVDVGHCQGRMFNIKSGAGTLKWLGPPRTPFIPSGGRNRCTRYLLSEGIPRSRTPVFEIHTYICYWYT